MSEDLWIPSLDESTLQEGTLTVATPKGVSILLVKKDGHLYALRNRCAHMSCDLSGGWLEGYTIKCPCHEWKYDIRTGEFLDAREIAVPTYPCKSLDGKVLIKMEESR